MRVLPRSQTVLCMIVAAAVSILPAIAAAQSPQVVVRAFASDGKPILDLTAAEITLRVDGRDREIKTLDLVSAPVPATGSATSGTPALPAPYATNAGAAAPSGGREFMIAIDDEGIAPGRDKLVRDAVKALASTISPADSISVVALRRGGLSLPATTDRAAVLEALARISATGSSTESTVDFGCRTKVVIAALGSLLEGAPVNRTILLFSSGVTTPTGDAIRESLGKEKDANEAICQVRQRELDDLSRVARSSAAAVFVVFVPEAVANRAHLQIGEAGLENIAGATSGEMIRMIGAAEGPMARIGDTAGIYYLATVAGLDGQQVQRIDARVKREDVRVSARPLASAAPAATAKAGTPKEMIRVATVYRGVPLRAAAFVSRQPGAKDLKVVALFEPDAAAAKLTAAMVGLFDEKGTLKAQWTAQPKELAGAPVLAVLAAPPGKYRMRVAASDASGSGGTTDYPLEVRLIDAAPVTLSDLLLGVGQNGFAPRLAFTSADAAAIGFIEIYGVPKDAKVDATFEILLPGGEVKGSGQGTVGAGSGDDARIAYGGFGLASLDAGDYTMRATISVNGKQAGVATRTLRKLN